MTGISRAERFFEGALRYWWLVLLAGVALIAATAMSLPTLTKDTSADAFIDADEPALVYKERVEEIFGLTDPIVIAVINRGEDGVFTPDNLALVERLTRAVERLPQVDPDRVVSLATENNIVGTEDGLIVEGFLDPDTEGFQAPLGTRARAEEVSAAIGDFPLYQGGLVGRRGTATLIIAEILDDDLATAAYDAVMALVAAEAIPEGTQVHVAGEGAVAGYLSTYIDNDASRLNPMAGLIITIVLLAAFVSLRAAILPNIIVLATVLGSFGLMAASGTSFFVITNGLVVNLIGIAVADSIHILSAYYTVLRDDPAISKRNAVARAMAQMWRPVTLTTITTVAGFLALSASSVMPPISAFGLFGALGVGLAWLYSMTLLPALLTVWPTRRIPYPFGQRRDGTQRRNAAERLMTALGRTVLASPKPVVAAGGVLTLIALAGASQLVVNEDRIENFKPSEPVYMADKAINADTDGIYNLDVLIETSRPGGLYDPEMLRRIEALQVFMESLEGVGGTTSIVDYVKQLHRAVNEGRPDFYTIPDDADLVAQLFFLYGASADPTDFEEEVDFDYQRALVRAQVSTGQYTNNKEIVPALEDYLRTTFNDEAATATATGRITVNYYWVRGIDQSTLLSVLLAFVAVTVAAIIVFRSLTAGLLAAMPVGLSVLLVYAVMGFAGIPLGVGTSMFAAIAIGLSIDFAIHALDRIRDIGRSEGLGPQALMALYPETGRALFFNFIAVAGGFGVLMTSDVPPLIKFGSLVAVAVSVAFIASVTLLPALVTLLKPKALLAPEPKEAAHASRPQTV
ncbi:efflux RND transporter permease subunit [Pyruvatibacter mobilis]|uniref:efflux RND transporter permease subunit n=1 Tax=Pyruvatibacter mobilis TaxID=1712261 RepID=UPI003C7D9852